MFGYYVFDFLGEYVEVVGDDYVFDVVDDVVEVIGVFVG